MDLFSISCTTCGARLKVRSSAAIGQIVACPKCHSMVLVAAPVGWMPPAERSQTPPSAAPQAASNGSHAGGGSAAARQQSLHAASKTAGASPAKMEAVAGDSDFSSIPSLTSTPAAVPQSATDASTLSQGSLSPLERAWQRWSLAIGLPATAVVMFMAVWGTKPDPASEQRAAATVVEAAQPSRAVAAGESTEPAVSLAEEPSQELEAHVIVQAAATDSADDESEDLSPLPPATPAASALEEVDGTQQASREVAEAVRAAQAEAEASVAAELTSEVTPEDRRTAARLEARLASIEFTDARLVDLIEFLSRMANVTIRLDPEALVAAKVDEGARVDLMQSGSNVGRALDAALEKLGLAYMIREGEVVIVTRSTAASEKRGAQP